MHALSPWLKSPLASASCIDFSHPHHHTGQLQVPVRAAVGDYD